LQSKTLVLADAPAAEIGSSKPVATLAHINIPTMLYEETIGFYEALMGFRRAISPLNPDPAQNTWLLDSAGRPCIHINALRPGEAQQSADSCLDHVAFDCTGRDTFAAKLKAMRVQFTETQTRVPEVVQLNLRDPNGIRVELTFGHEFLRPRLIASRNDYT
jgi:catechol 2,3-dioxygenase-like lactoylglutathione lyase family enzyme